MFEAAIGTAVCFILLFGYLGYKRVAHFALIVDVAIFAFCIYIFMGTYAGMMTGIIAGVIISLFLKLVRRSVGTEKPTLVRYEGDLMPTWTWEEIKAGDA